MEVTYKNRTITFDKRKVKKLSFEDFDKLCRGSSVFKGMPPKKRESEIERLYNENISKSKKPKNPGLGSGVHTDNKPGLGSTPGAKQKPASKGADSEGAKDNTELQE